MGAKYIHVLHKIIYSNSPILDTAVPMKQIFRNYRITIDHAYEPDFDNEARLQSIYTKRIKITDRQLEKLTPIEKEWEKLTLDNLQGPLKTIINNKLIDETSVKLSVM